MRGCGLDSNGSGGVLTVNSCEDCDEPYGSKKIWGFSNSRDYQSDSCSLKCVCNTMASKVLHISCHWTVTQNCKEHCKILYHSCNET